jgi:putative spermidine/putrescine transport system substrate-binding protein
MSQGGETSGEVIEAALMADGVTPEKMYPIDVNRALASLDKLGKENIVWATSLQEPVQRIGSGETPLGGLYTGRAILGKREGAPIGITLNQGIIGGSVLSVIKNSKNQREAFALMNYVATRTDQAAKFTMKTTYGTPHIDLKSMLPADAPDEVIAALPTNPILRKTGLLINDDWWADNLTSVAARFKEWQLS